VSRAATTLFLPCRAGSERVPDKNTRPFAGYPGGLLGLKLEQLERVRDGLLTDVVLDSNDPRVLELGEAKRRTWGGSAALTVRERPDHLGRSSTTTDALIAYALDTLPCEVLAWTHVTSPLFSARSYERAFDAFHARDSERHDSLMTVTPLHGFVWDEGGPLNYPRGPLRWPRTQDLRPLYEVNSALFIVPRAVGLASGDRIGDRPMLHATGKVESADIDWPDDFTAAEALYRAFAARDPREESS